MTSCSVFRSRFATVLKQGQPRIRCAGKILAVEGGLGLYELEGGIEVTSSKATGGDWKLGANGCRGASWSKECSVAACRQLRGECSVFWTSRVFMAIAPFLHRMVC